MLGKPVLQTGLPSLSTPANPRPSIFKSSRIIKILIFVSLPYFYFDFKDCLVFFYLLSIPFLLLMTRDIQSLTHSYELQDN